MGPNRNLGQRLSNGVGVTPSTRVTFSTRSVCGGSGTRRSTAARHQLPPAATIAARGTDTNEGSTPRRAQRLDERPLGERLVVRDIERLAAAASPRWRARTPRPRPTRTPLRGGIAAVGKKAGGRVACRAPIPEELLAVERLPRPCTYGGRNVTTGNPLASCIEHAGWAGRPGWCGGSI